MSDVDVVVVAGFAVSVARLLLNPVFMLLVLASCLSGFSMNGTYLFLPKYLQHQFDIPAWKANFIMGRTQTVVVVVVVGAAAAAVVVVVVAVTTAVVVVVGTCWYS